tara:strand:- start:14265 stop:15926 length:1662 start_codon:yes stop_codon:yes gene_type:complete
MHTDQDLNSLLKENAFFELTEEVVLGKKLSVFKNRPKNLAKLLTSSLNHENKLYLLNQNKEISFIEHYELVTKAIHLLRSKYKIQPGDRIAIYGANSFEWIIFFWASVSIGAIACALNGWWNGKEAIKALNDAQPKLLIADQKRFDRLNSYKNSDKLITDHFSFTQLVDSDNNFYDADEDECACLLYTSGTTGSPKGVMTSHRSMISNTMLQLLQGASVSMRSSKLGVDWTKNAPKTLLTSPLFHVSGLSAGAVTSLFAGTSTFLYEGKFSAKAIIGIIEKFKITSWGGAVPTALRRVVNFAQNKAYDLTSMLVIGGGGAPIPEKLIKKTKLVFPNVKHNFGYGYGLTESGAITIINWGDPMDKHPTSPGQPMPTIEIELRDNDGDVITSDNVEGEIFVRSPSVMLGYYNKPSETKKVLSTNRFLKTGDFGYISNGLFYISSRRTDLILRGGENVYPQEIELLLDVHDKVTESAVVGVPNKDLGQEVKAYVVMKDLDVNLKDLENYLKEHLAYFKIPTLWEIVQESLPRNASGKVMKHVLINSKSNNMINEDE